MDGFERLFVINLKARVDRRIEMEAQLRGIGLSFSNPKVELLEAIRPADAGGFPTVGARGCFMSHLKILELAVKADLKRILIVEDDLNFSSDFITRAPLVISCADKMKWSFLYGGHRVERALTATAECSEIEPSTAVVTAHFLGLQGQAIQDAAAYIRAMLQREPGHPVGGPMHVDGAYSWFRRDHPQYRTVVAIPPLGYQRASRTDIHELRWYDKTPGLRQVVARIRRASNT